MELSEIQERLKNKNIKVVGLRVHSKASEKYVDVLFSYPSGSTWEGSIPYYYRRTGLFLDSAETIAALVDKSYELVTEPSVGTWVAAEKQLWKTEYDGKGVTKAFFYKLLNLKWNSVEGDLPANRNWARRIQDIKEMGYTLATDTRRYCPKLKRNTTHILLLPFPRGVKTGYETFSPTLRKRIISVLGSYDAYEGKVRPSNLLLPDHKFPEISWDEKTREKNPDEMTDEEIRAKFQLLDNQRNLEKREACRRVIQTSNVGTIFGINYYLNGKDWPVNIPKVGKEAEQGWKLCPWYDIEAWRKSLNKFIEDNSKRS
jgi:hypothetical protein